MQLPTMKQKSHWVAPSLNLSRAACRTSTLNIPHNDKAARLPSDPNVAAHCEIEFNEEDCAITNERLQQAQKSCSRSSRKSCVLTLGEMKLLQNEQNVIRKTLFGSSSSLGGSIKGGVQKMGDSSTSVASSMGGSIMKGVAGVKKMGSNAACRLRNRCKRY